MVDRYYGCTDIHMKKLVVFLNKMAGVAVGDRQDHRVASAAGFPFPIFPGYAID